MKRLDIAGMGVRLAGGTDRQGGGTGPLVVLMHGFGVRGDDLVPLGRAVDAPPGTRWAFPEAPIVVRTAPVEGRGWWRVDIDEMTRALNTGGFEDRAEYFLSGLLEVRANLLAMLRELRARLAPSKVVLGGFSQGAMLATSVLLRTEEELAGLAILSSTGVEDGSPTFDRTSVPIFLSHGESDAALPFTRAEKLRDSLSKHGMRVTWSPFAGGHELSNDMMRNLGSWLKQTL
jgi:phospholipase/carboxylesterase